MEDSAELPHFPLKAYFCLSNVSILAASDRYEAKEKPWIRFHSSRGDAYGILQNYTGIFEYCLEYKKWLDLLERSASKGLLEPTSELLAEILNYEYQIYKLYVWANIPLNRNPFLSHWVETVQQWQDMSKEHAGGKPKQTPLSWRSIQEVRVAFIQRLLKQREFVDEAIAQSPGQLVGSLQVLGAQDFSLQEYIQILEEENVYERSGPPEQYVTNREDILALRRPTLDETEYTAERVFEHLVDEPELADELLTQLPLDIPSLDLFTMSLQDGTIDQLHIDPVSTVRNFVQHSLRQIEAMGEPLSALRVAPKEGIEVGREAQGRAVRLLVLFISNLVRKALVPPEELIYEISEICVRYIFLPEVRDLQRFVEGMS